MYVDSKKQWNVIVGCKFNCIYCKKSFQAQMKRRKPVIDKNGKKRGCQSCYDYIPHFHKERLIKEWIKKNLPKTTEGDQFIWVCSSSDIYFAEEEWIWKIIDRIEELPDQTFFFQTKNPEVYTEYDFPKNVILGITLESNVYYPEISDAPPPYERCCVFNNISFPRKIITVEPILEFDFCIFLGWIRKINPERIYLGYDSHNNDLPEPSIIKTIQFGNELSKFTKVKFKYMKGSE